MYDERIYVTRSSMPEYEEYIEAIRPLWDSHWLTNMGKYHQQLEMALKKYLMVPEVSLMVNGHMALELAIQAFGFPEGSEVITTPFTFISTTHAIVRNRLKPVFCDIKECDGTIDETKIEDLITKNTVAIVPVHVYGNICNVDEIQHIASKYDLKVIYDAAHAFGVKDGARGIGHYGDVSVFSFHATKVFNTIEGGAVTFKDHDIYEKLYNLKNFGIRDEEFVADIGANAKMNEFCAIMGLCNLKHIDKAIQERQKTSNSYDVRIEKIKGIKKLEGHERWGRNYAYYPIVFTEDYAISRDKVYEKLRSNDIYARKYFYPLTSEQSCYRNAFRFSRTPLAKKLAERVLALPLYEGLEEKDIGRICDLL